MRSKKSGTPKESQVQSAIEDHLKLLEGARRCTYIKNNSSAYKTERGGFVRLGQARSPEMLALGGQDDYR